MTSSIIPQTSPSLKKGDLVTVLESEIPKYVAIYGGKDQGNDKYFPLHSFSHEMKRYRGIAKVIRPIHKFHSLVRFNEIVKLESAENDTFLEQIHIVKNIDGIDSYYAFIESADNDRVLITPIKMLGKSADSLIGSQVKVAKDRCSKSTGAIEVMN